MDGKLVAGPYVSVHGDVSDFFAGFGTFVDNGEVEGDWHASLQYIDIVFYFESSINEGVTGLNMDAFVADDIIDAAWDVPIKFTG